LCSLSGKQAGNEDPTKQALFYTLDNPRSGSLPLFPLDFSENRFELELVAHELASPASGGLQEFRRYISDPDSDEP
jgi:hypothetical protein